MPLEVRDLRMYYEIEGKGWVKAVDGVSFTLKEEESLGIVGESGCGKSSLAMTLLRVLPTNAKIFSGEVILDGVNILELPESRLRREVRWQKIAMVFQGSMNALNPIVKVGDQIVEAILTHKQMSKKRAWKRAQKLLKMVGLDPSIAHRYPFELSGGQKQRSVMAMALALRPKILIADEPTTNLDVTVQLQILYLIKRLREEFSSSIIYITHDMGVIAEMCDRVAVMYAGSIVELADVIELFKNPLHPYTRGLLESIPRPGQPFKSIPGTVPSLINPPKGCRFHERCPYAMEICNREKPKFVEVKKNHFVQCFLYQSKSSKD